MKAGFVCSLFATLCLSLVHIEAQGQNDEPRVSFHVTSVKSQASPIDCRSENDNCSATRFTVEGYIETKRGDVMVEFVLTCDEIIRNAPSPHFATTCSKVHASSDYQVLVFDDAVIFGKVQTRIPDTGPVQMQYDIVSEKEVSRRPCK